MISSLFKVVLYPFQYPTPPAQSPVPDILQFATFNTLSVAECKRRLKGIATIDDSIICALIAKNIGACMGDSGVCQYFMDII